MANVKSAEKRNRQNQKRRARNTAVRSAVRTAAHSALSAIKKDAKSATASLSATTSVLAKAAQRGVIPKGRLARKVSRLYKARNKALAGGSAT